MSKGGVFGKAGIGPSFCVFGEAFGAEFVPYFFRDDGWGGGTGC